MTLFYSKLKDEKTKEYTVINQEEAKELGWEQNELDVGYDGHFYLKGCAPEKTAPTKEEISSLREQAYIKEVDILHAQRQRKTILGTWTEEDEANYINEVKRLSEDVANRYPYPEPDQQTT